MVPVYLALVLHAVVLLRYDYWLTPLGLVMAVLMLAGSVCACVSLFGLIGIKRKAVGVIDRIEYLADVRVNAISIQLKSRWPGHVAGQFAFLKFDASEGAHPFTISSAWQGNGRVSFLIKALGDYTRTLACTLKVGDLAEVEGPYGRFDFEGSCRRQIWVGAGIGITPFVARMKLLASCSDGRVVDLFHTTTDVDEHALKLLVEDANASNIHLHLMIDARDGRLNGEIIRAKIKDWNQSDVWFCGPSGFAESLRCDLIKHGLPPEKFHQEFFSMR